MPDNYPFELLSDIDHDNVLLSDFHRKYIDVFNNEVLSLHLYCDEIRKSRFQLEAEHQLDSDDGLMLPNEKTTAFMAVVDELIAKVEGFSVYYSDLKDAFFEQSGKKKDTTSIDKGSVSDVKNQLDAVQQQLREKEQAYEALLLETKH